MSSLAARLCGRRGPAPLRAAVRSALLGLCPIRPDAGAAGLRGWSGSGSWRFGGPRRGLAPGEQGGWGGGSASGRPTRGCVGQGLRSIPLSCAALGEPPPEGAPTSARVRGRPPASRELLSSPAAGVWDPLPGSWLFLSSLPACLSLTSRARN